jgi:4-amino-4-deoxy-L-arabinose transferase-like glycosyltransferase
VSTLVRQHPPQAGRRRGVVALRVPSARRIPLPLAILLVIAAIHGLAWSVATAPLQGPDEIAHASYVQYMAETGHAPNSNGGTNPISTEMGQVMTRLNLSPILGHVEGRPIWNRAPGIDRTLDDLPSRTRKDGSGPNPTGTYPPLYYAYDALAYRLTPSSSLLDRLFVMRLATVALFVATVALAWLVAAELFAAQWARALLTALVALNPKLGATSGVVNPDTMLVLESTAFLLVGLRLVQRGPTDRRTLVLAAIGALAMLTHSRALFLLPAAVIVLGVAFLRHRPALRPALRMAAMAAGVLGVGTVLGVVWNHAHATGIQYGGAAADVRLVPREFVSYVWQFYFPKLTVFGTRLGPDYGYRQVFINSFFGSFASLEVNYKPSVYDALQVAAALGLAALYTTVVARWRTLMARWPVVLVCVGLFACLLGLLHFVSYTSLKTSAADPVITGRYLLPAVALYAAAVTFVAVSLPRRVGGALAGVLVAGSALLSVGGVAISIARFYG